VDKSDTFLSPFVVIANADIQLSDIMVIVIHYIISEFVPTALLG